jgi:hypothetical protein
MTPDDVHALDDDTYNAFVAYMERDAREQARAIADAKRRR